MTAVDVVADLEARGLVHDSTDRHRLRARLRAQPITLYCGFDPTADSLHAGNLLGILALRRFQLAGHRPLALAGGATGMVGDPSGRSEERNLLDEATLTANLEGITTQLSRMLDFDAGPASARLVDNREWTADLRVLDFLRDVGKHVTVNQMVAKESVRARMQSESGISYTEFSYMLLQAHDFLWLYDRLGCDLQVGGSDQWGNITAGIDLIRRRTGSAVHGLTWPLLTGAGGQKMGKTSGERVWLSAERTSPYRFYQHWVQTDDADVERFLLQLTLLPVGEALEVAAASAQAPERREGQRRLAWEVTAFVHGAAQADAARSASEVLFGSDPRQAPAAALDALAAEVPTTDVSIEHLGGGLDLPDVLAETGLASSKGDARRALAQGGVYVNQQRADPGRRLAGDDALQGRYVLLRKGKRAYHLLRVTR